MLIIQKDQLVDSRRSDFKLSFADLVIDDKLFIGGGHGDVLE